MAPSDYYPLSSLTPNEADAPVQHDGNFQYEPNHLTPAVYSTIPGVPSHSIPRKPLQSSETTSQPRPLKSARPWYTLLTQGVLDIVLCIAPLTFFGLAWCALSLSGKEVSRWGTSVQEWSLIVRDTLYSQSICTDVTVGAYNLSNSVRSRSWPLDGRYSKSFARTGHLVDRMLLQLRISGQ